jgi:hypothetical protein
MLMLLRTRSAVLILLALLFGCQTSAAPPSAEDVARSYPEFYFQALPLIGLHLDHDASGIIFRYSVAPNEQPVWLERISASARANGWRVVREDQSGQVQRLQLQRIDDPRHRYRDYHSLEIVRITSCGSALLIAGIQVDVKKQSDLAEITAEGPRWYQKRFWPLVTKYEGEACGT